MRLPASGYCWCPTCGAETHDKTSDICVCGAMVGRHDAQLRCSCNKGWVNQVNPLIRRKVAVVTKPKPLFKPVRLTASHSELFDDGDD